MRGIAIGADGSAYVSDVGNFRIDVFASDGTFVRAFGEDVNPGGGDVCTTASGCQEGLDGEGAGAMNEPQGLAFGPEGNLFVADKKNNRIDVFSPDGAFLRAFGKDVNTGPGDPDVCTTECEPGDSTGVAGAMDGPTGITADAGALYVSDYGNGRIDVFAPDGTFLRAFGKDVNTGPGDPDVCTTECKGAEVGGSAGMMRLPRAVAVAPGNQIMVADTENQRIDIFSTAGVFIRAFGKDVKPGGGNICTTATGCVEGTIGTAAGALAYPSGVTAGAAGNLYVAELNNNRVSEFTIDGTFVRAFGEGVDTGAAAFQICTAASGCQQGVVAGTVAGATPEPQGLAVDCRGTLYVTEELAGFARVERFGEPGTALPPCVDPAPPSIKVSLIPFVRVSNRIRFNGLKLNRGNGTAVLFVRVPGSGRVILKGRGVRRLSRGAPRAKVVRLPIKPKVRLKRFVKRHGKGRIRVEVTFRPVGGEPRTIEKAIVLRRKR